MQFDYFDCHDHHGRLQNPQKPNHQIEMPKSSQDARFLRDSDHSVHRHFLRDISRHFGRQFHASASLFRFLPVRT
jgi:hypothetical protein